MDILPRCLPIMLEMLEKEWREGQWGANRQRRGRCELQAAHRALGELREALEVISP